MSENRDQLLTKIISKKCMVGVVGLGYVGLPLAIRFAEEGYQVVGLDNDKRKIAKISAGQSYIKHIPDSKIAKLSASGFEATDEFSSVSRMDAVIICVPTPLNKFREPDMSYILSTLNEMRSYLRVGQVISLESTTYPGTTEEILRPGIESCGLEIGRDVFLVYSPEREDPGRLDYSTRTIPKIVGGSTPNCLQVGVALYRVVIDEVVAVSSTQTAEMTKLLENIHRAVNIGLVNEMKIVCDKMKIDVNEVIDAAATKPFGFVAYRPGPGLGGHCIPIDPFYLTWKAREFGVHTRFIELAGEINSGMPNFVIEKVQFALNRVSKSVRNSKILILGLSYKKNVDDYRESPSLALIKVLVELGAKVAFADPFFTEFPEDRHISFKIPITNIDPETLSAFDLVLLATDHDEFPYEMIYQNSALIVDTRGRFRKQASHIIHA